MPFRMPTEIMFGSGELDRLPGLIEGELRAEQPLLVSDRGVEAAGHVDRVAKLCQPIEVFLDIEPNPRHQTINRLGEAARQLQPDLVIGLGGGSVLDSAKAIALLASNPGNIEEYEGREKYQHPPLPVLAIPTTCGTGSEVTWVAVITHIGRRFKMSIKGKGLFPRYALLDPDLLATLPPFLVASTGLDALTHALEAAIVKPANPLSDFFARQAIDLILSSIEPAYRDIRNDKRARENMLLGSMLAGVAFGNADVGAVHCLSEALGALFDLPHGMANAVFLPHVLEFMARACPGKMTAIAIWVGIQEAREEAAIEMLLHQVKELSRRLGIPSLRDLGIKREDFAEIARRAAINNSNPSNPREMGEAEYIQVLDKAY